MIRLLTAWAVSFVVHLFVVRSAHKHARFSHDHDVTGPQKFHARPVPRVGGLGIVAGVAAATAWACLSASQSSTLALVLLACAMPVFIGGITEDLTKRVSPRDRLLAAALSAALAAYFADGVIDHTDIPGLDLLIAGGAGSALLAVFVVSGFANAMNIIDGFNGLASMCSVIMLVGVTYVAYLVGDSTIGTLALSCVGAVFGFFVWNFPAGLIFLGDGGAYFLGFFVAELAILLVHRNPTVSPMFALLLGIYPVFETLFSIYRRRILRGRPAGVPDGVHLHSLIYRRFLRWAAGERTARELTRRNSMTAPYLWMLCTSSTIPAVLFWDSTPALGVSIVVFVMIYLRLYWGIVRFRSPRWLQLRRGR